MKNESVRKFFLQGWLVVNQNPPVVKNKNPHIPFYLLICFVSFLHDKGGGEGGRELTQH